MKLACSFDVFVSKDRDFYGDYELDVDDCTIVTSDWRVPPDSIEFDPDVLESIRQTDQFKSCVPEKWYHIFAYGDLNAEYSSSLETGREFDGWGFDAEFIYVQELPLLSLGKSL